MAELQTHPELDTDGDGVLSEGEAQVPHALPWPRIPRGDCPGRLQGQGAGTGRLWAIPMESSPLAPGQGCWGTWPRPSEPGGQPPSVTSPCPLEPGGVVRGPQGVWLGQSQVSHSRTPTGSHECLCPICTPHVCAFGSLHSPDPVPLQSVHHCPLLGPSPFLLGPCLFL